MSSTRPHFPSSTLLPRPWPRGDPVPIIPPSNDHRRIQEPAPSSTRTRNPHDRRLINHSIGNTTSRSTLVQKGSMSSGPSPKRRKLDNYPLPSTNSKDFPHLVPDDDDHEFSSDMGHKSSKKRFAVVGDGEKYTEMVSAYSSPIESFSPETTRPSLVTERINHFESTNGIRRLDLAKETLKNRMKGRSKGSKMRLKPAMVTRTQNAQPEDQSDKIPIHSCFVDTVLWESTPQQQLWMYTQNKRLFIEENSKKVVNGFVLDGYKMLLAKPGGVKMSSTIQFIPPDLNGPITIRLHIDRSDWDDGAYTRFVEKLKTFGVGNQIMRSGTVPLWEVAEQNAKVQADETRKHKTALEERKQLRSKPRQMKIDPPVSRRATTTTTSLKRKADLDSEDAHAAPPSRPKPALPEPNLRSRLALDTEPVPSAQANPDEVVLSYPAGLPGAVNITKLDLERLNPGAFLNDTLIEFGLKVWLRDLETSNPELVDQIHVFSSFFYKKLNSKKDLQVAYESVRKWTNKFDIFQKRYIIVPINEHLHWYLAIIYEPEHVLKSPLVVNHKSPPRPQTRLATAQAISEIDSNSSRIDQCLDSLEPQMEDLDRHSEGEVERDLEDFQVSCTIEDCVPRQPDSHSNYEYFSRSSDDVMTSPNHPVSPVTPKDVGTSVSLPTSAKGQRSVGIVDAKRFYQSANPRKYGKKEVQTVTTPPGMDADPNEKDEIEIIDNVPKTYIFTFDSLGGRHPGVSKRLSAYLKMEAKSKKGVDAAGIVEGKAAMMPCQTNLCDCGIYLLHFAKTFMQDPRKYADIILAKRRSLGDKERRSMWHVDDDFEPEGRQQIRLRIESLSEDWKKLRDGAHKLSEEVMNKDDESEGEVELVESDADKHSKSSRNAQQKTSPASRVRG